MPKLWSYGIDIPAKAGIQKPANWIPAFAGMTNYQRQNENQFPNNLVFIIVLSSP
jgi:hypothetical protein